MSRFTMALGGATMLGATCAMAAEPVQLTDQELDVVTAGAQVGALIASFAVTGPKGSAEAFGVDGRVDSGVLVTAAEANAPPGGPRSASAVGAVFNATNFGPLTDVGTAAAQQGGTVFVLDGPLFASAIGIFSGRVETTGTGFAENGAETLIIGGTPVINEVLVVTLPDNDGVSGMVGTLAAALH